MESSNRTLLEKAVLGFSIKHDFWIEKLHTDTLIEIASHNQNSIISFANLLAIIAHCCDSPIKYLLPPRIVIGKVRKYHESFYRNDLQYIDNNFRQTATFERVKFSNLCFKSLK